MKKILTYILLLSLAACTMPGSDDGKSVYMASIEPLQRVLGELAGNDAATECLMPQGANPEAFEPGMEQMKALSGAKVFFTAGTLPFESVMAEKQPSLTIVAMADGTPGQDPHIWSSVSGIRAMAAKIAAALPDNEATRLNAARFNAKLDSVSSIIHSQLDSLKCRDFLVWHPSLTYFAQEYGLHQIAFEQHGKETSAHDLKARIDAARQSSAKVFFVEKEFDSRLIDPIIEELGVKKVEINLMGQNFIDELVSVAKALHDNDK